VTKNKIVVERYAFCLNQKLTIGKAQEFFTSARSTAPFRPQVLTFNVPEPGLVYIKSILINGVPLWRGDEIDAHEYYTTSMGQWIDSPTVREGDSIAVDGRYTGQRPSWISFLRSWKFWNRPVFLFACVLKGPV
jgi:hypothetical protein